MGTMLLQLCQQRIEIVLLEKCNAMLHSTAQLILEGYYYLLFNYLKDHINQQTALPVVQLAEWGAVCGASQHPKR